MFAALAESDYHRHLRGDQGRVLKPDLSGSRLTSRRALAANAADVLIRFSRRHCATTRNARFRVTHGTRLISSDSAPNIPTLKPRPPSTVSDDELAGHHALQSRAVLGAVDALRFASTGRSARPSGIDGACAQRTAKAFT
jgi:hypothetical protein